jgi:FAD/FMN-containing dehydrogenase
VSDAALLSALHALVGDAGLLTDPAEMAGYAVDWRKLFPGKPLAVLRPKTAAEVAAVVKACRAAGIALVPQSGNTGMAGGAAPDASGRQIVLSLARMNSIRAVDPVGLTIEVEAGVVLAAAKDAAAEQGRFLPVSFAAEGSAMIGGVISTNAGGINVLRYGMTRAMVLGLEVVLADGTLVGGLRRLRKDNAGYDWKQLFIGSEGTLGIVTAAVLRLVPQPRHSVTAFLAVESPAMALALLDRAQTEIGEALSAFELISGPSIGLVEKHAGLKCPIARAGWFVLIEATSTLPGLKEAAQTLLEGAFEAGLALDGVVAESEAQTRQLWALRENITESEARSGKSVKHDISVPLTATPAFVAEADAALQAATPGVKLNIFGHLGDGNLHFNVLVGTEHDAGLVNRTVHDLVARHGGSISAEHGIGQYRVAELQRTRSAEELALMARIKAALDPEGGLNPGKVLPGKVLPKGCAP